MNGCSLGISRSGLSLSLPAHMSGIFCHSFANVIVKKEGSHLLLESRFLL